MISSTRTAAAMCIAVLWVAAACGDEPQAGGQPAPITIDISDAVVIDGAEIKGSVFLRGVSLLDLDNLEYGSCPSLSADELLRSMSAAGRRPGWMTVLNTSKAIEASPTRLTYMVIVDETTSRITLDLGDDEGFSCIAAVSSDSAEVERALGVP